MIQKTTYKDRPAYQVTGERLTAVFLPEDGGKMASLKNGDRELLAQAPGEHYLRLLPDGEYVPSECSGFDDMFPTIDPYSPQNGMYRGKTYPDHGEVCRYPMDVKENDAFLELSFESKLFEIRYGKRISCDEGGIAIEYTIENKGEETFPYIWAAHCMLQAHPDAEILFPYAADAPICTMFGKQLSRTRTEPRSDDGENYKYYFTEKIAEGWCGYRYADGKTLMLHYPAEVIRYLGVWVNNGSFKSMYNIALEPCTAPYDKPDAAMASGYCSVLQPGESVNFRLLFTIQEGVSND